MLDEARDQVEVAKEDVAAARAVRAQQFTPKGVRRQGDAFEP